MDSSSLHTLQEIVQHNCHISDARYAADYTLCIYLLKMREYYRWEKGIAQTAVIQSDDVGQWLTEREQLWDSLEDEEYQPISLAGHDFDPFDVKTINEHLIPKGLVYSAGYGNRGAAHFFLADLVADSTVDQSRLLISAHEHARDLTSPPAMSLGNTIFVRRASFRRMLWEKIQESQWAKCDTPMKRALADYDFDADPEDSLDAITEHQINLLKLHERGEQRVEQLWGQAWAELLMASLKTRLEFRLRGIRDYLADCLVTLPELTADGDPEQIHFYFASLTPGQKELFPKLIVAYEHWLVGGDLSRLNTAVEKGRQHWNMLGGQLMEIHGSGNEQWDNQAHALIDKNTL